MSSDSSDSDPTTAVLLIAHGSRRPAANQDLFDLADRLAAQGPFQIVQASFLELAEPDILAGGGRCVERGAGRVLMVPYLLAAGVHVQRDLAASREELAARHPGVAFVLGPPLGPHPLLDRLVAERIRETDALARPGPPPTNPPADDAGVEVDEVWSRG